MFKFYQNLSIKFRLGIDDLRDKCLVIKIQYKYFDS